METAEMKYSESGRSENINLPFVSVKLVFRSTAVLELKWILKEESGFPLIESVKFPLMATAFSFTCALVPVWLKRKQKSDRPRYMRMLFMLVSDLMFFKRA